MNQTRSVTFVIADDDADDRLLLADAFRESRLRNPLVFVEDGIELIDYLKRRDKYADRKDNDPTLVLLDLNMPRMDGRTALTAIKSDPELRRFPVVVFTTSRSEEDIVRSYDLGVNSFITKPVTFDALVEVVRSLNHYWIDIVELPTPRV
jgi:CheY-like chemotaxis protein